MAKEKLIKETFFVEITDEREADLESSRIYQSCEFATKEEAIKFGRQLAQKIGKSDISFMKDINTCHYLKPTWEYSAKGVKKSLHVDVMVKEYYSETDEIDKDNYDIEIEANIK